MVVTADASRFLWVFAFFGSRSTLERPQGDQCNMLKNELDI